MPVQECDGGHHEHRLGTVGTVGDWSCRAPAGGPGAVECVAADEIALQRTGFYLKHVGRRTVSADPNHAVFFRRGEEYRVSHPVPGGDTCTVLRPDPALLDEVAGTLPVERVWLDERTFAVQSMLRRVLRRPPGPCETVEAEELFVWLVDRVLRAAARPRDTGPLWTHGTAVDRVKEFLAAHYPEALTLARIAAETAYSPFHLCRVFRRATGLPIHQYLIQLRLRAALDRLFDARDRLSHLAVDVGFSSHSHFADAFRRAFGVTPSHMRGVTDLRDVRAIAGG